MRKIINIVAIILVLGVIAVLGYYTYRYFNEPPTELNALDLEILDQAKADAKAEASITKHLVDEHGLKHAITMGTDNLITLAEFSALSDTIVAKDQIIDVLERENARLERYIRAQASINIKEDIPLEKYQDDAFTLSHENLKLEISAPDSTGTRYLRNYSYDIAWNYLNYSKRSLFRRNYYTDTWVDDPYATIRGVQRFTIQHPRPKWQFKVSGTGEYNPHLGLSYGGTASLGYRSLNLQTSYLYNHNYQDWFPQIRLSYNLIDY